MGTPNPEAKTFRGNSTFVAKGNNRRIEVVTENDVMSRFAVGCSPTTITAATVLFLNQTDSKLYGFGINTSGQIGNSAVINLSSPVAVAGTQLWNWIHMPTGFPSSVGQVTIGIDQSGALYTWGTNANGLSLGQGNAAAAFAVSSPIQIVTTQKFLSAYGTILGGGSFIGRAIDADGGIWTWGAEYGTGGYGDGTQGVQKSAPVQVAGSGTVTKFVAFGWSAQNTTSANYALGADGTMWAWGTNTGGGLGNNTSPAVVSGVSSPVQVLFPAGVSIAKFFPQSTSCIALDTQGRLWAWGNNFNGNLGINSPLAVSSPTQIATPGAGKVWVDVMIGVNGGTMCGLDSAGGIWTWGSNSPFGGHSGYLGQGSGDGTIKVSSPVQVTPAGVTFRQLVRGPDNQMMFAPFSNVYSGQSAGCAFFAAIDTNNNLWTWGSNIGGNLGINTSGDSSSPTQVVGTTKFLNAYMCALGGGGSYGMVGIDLSGNLWYWGTNTKGVAGQGVSPAVVAAYSSPVQVILPGNRKVINIYSFESSETALWAVANDGQVYSWGSNANGQLGQGTASTTVAVSSPIQVVGNRNVNLTQLQTFTELDVSPGASIPIQMPGIQACFGQRQVGFLANKMSIVYNT